MVRSDKAVDPEIAPDQSLLHALPVVFLHQPGEFDLDFDDPACLDTGPVRFQIPHRWVNTHASHRLAQFVVIVGLAHISCSPSGRPVVFPVGQVSFHPGDPFVGLDELRSQSAYLFPWGDVPVPKPDKWLRA